MNSINKNQPEDNRENLNSSSAIKKIREMAEKAKTCFFTTIPDSDESLGTRPMAIQEVDNAGALWILSANDSHTNKDIIANPAVKLYFQGSAHSDFLYLEGEANISEDKERIKKLWNPLFKTWFTEGENDSRISVIKVMPSTGYYWDNKHGNTIAGLKILVGAAIGKTLDDSIEGNLTV